MTPRKARYNQQPTNHPDLSTRHSHSERSGRWTKRRSILGTDGRKSRCRSLRLAPHNPPFIGVLVQANHSHNRRPKVAAFVLCFYSTYLSIRNVGARVRCGRENILFGSLQLSSSGRLEAAAVILCSYSDPTVLSPFSPVGLSGECSGLATGMGHGRKTILFGLPAVAVAGSRKCRL